MNFIKRFQAKRTKTKILKMANDLVATEENDFVKKLKLLTFALKLGGTFDNAMSLFEANKQSLLLLKLRDGLWHHLEDEAQTKTFFDNGKTMYIMTPLCTDDGKEFMSIQCGFTKGEKDDKWHFSEENIRINNLLVDELLRDVKLIGKETIEKAKSFLDELVAQSSFRADFIFSSWQFKSTKVTASLKTGVVPYLNEIQRRGKYLTPKVYSLYSHFLGNKLSAKDLEVASFLNENIKDADCVFNNVGIKQHEYNGEYIQLLKSLILSNDTKERNLLFDAMGKVNIYFAMGDFVFSKEAMKAMKIVSGFFDGDGVKRERILDGVELNDGEEAQKEQAQRTVANGEAT